MPTLGAVRAASWPVALGGVLLLAGVALVMVGALGWRGRLPRNRFAGVRTAATMRSPEAFAVANRVAGPPTVAAGAVLALGGGFTAGATGPTAAVVAAVCTVGGLVLVVAGGLLGHRSASALAGTAPARCANCICAQGRPACASSRSD